MHAVLTRELIAACGGLDEAASACRLKKSRLSECQTPGAEAFLPIDVVAELEAYGGKPIYSQALVSARPAAGDGSLFDDVAGITEDAAALQRLVRTLDARKGPMTPREAAIIDAALAKLQRELDEARAAASEPGSDV